MYVKNISGTQKSINIYDRESDESVNYSTFKPVVLEMNGREAETIVPYRIEGRTIDDEIKKLTVRPMNLAPGETIIHSINIKKIYNLVTGVRYRIKGYFHPDFKENITFPSYNELIFTVTSTRSDSITTGIRYPERLNLPSRELAPSEVIKLLLIAEKEKDWVKVLKYLNIEKFINVYPEFINQYLHADDDDEKLKIADNFIIFLSKERDDYLVDFKVHSEDVNINTAYVEVIIERFGGRMPQRYKYRYTLEKYTNLWLVVNLEAIVLKGKKS